MKPVAADQGLSTLINARTKPGTFNRTEFDKVLRPALEQAKAEGRKLTRDEVVAVVPEAFSIVLPQKRPERRSPAAHFKQSIRFTYETLACRPVHSARSNQLAIC